MSSAVIVFTACTFIFGCVIGGDRDRERLGQDGEPKTPEVTEPLVIPVPPQLQVGDKLLNLAGPTGARCVATTPDGEIVLQRAPGTMFLPAKYAKTDIVCQLPTGGPVTKINIHKFSPAGERILNIGPRGRTYKAG